MVGVVLANELLDALPVHRVAFEGGRLREVFVGWSDGHFVEVVGELSTAHLAEWFEERHVALAEGQRAEVNLAMLDWLAEVGGHTRPRPRAPLRLCPARRRALRAQADDRHSACFPRAPRQQRRPSGVGRQDLTAHVDLDALADGAQAAGLQVAGKTTQAEFLVGVGLSELLDQERAEAGEDWARQLELRASVGRLLDPRHLGGYAVVALGKGVDPAAPLRGFGFKLERPDAL